MLKRYVAGWRKFHRETAGAKIMPKLLAKQHLNVRLIVDRENDEIYTLAPALLLPPTLPETEKLVSDARHIHTPLRLAN